MRQMFSTILLVLMLPTSSASLGQLMPPLQPRPPLGPRRLPDCIPPLSSQASDLGLKDYSLAGGRIAIGLPAEWSRYGDDRANQIRVNGRVGESVKVTFVSSKSPASDAWSFATRRIPFGSSVPLPVPLPGGGAEWRGPIIVTFNDDFLSPHGDVLRTVDLVVELLFDGFVAIEEEHPRAGSCAPGLFSAVRKSLRVKP